MNKARNRNARSKLLREINIERLNTFPEDGARSPWYVLMTPPGRELDAAILLDRLGIRVYAPTEKKAVRGAKSRMRLRIVHTLSPFLPRYLFVARDQDKDLASALYRTNYVRGILASAGKVAEISGKTVRDVTLPPEERGAPVDSPTPGARLDPSKPCRIDEGPLRGWSFPVLELKENEVRLAVELFGVTHPQWLRIDHVSQPL